ncbi:hypothetical protein TNCV_35781 [Trichonephila clavipes]|nr:hypothetical protein TNCV_35781 [Trichonephila clavipes]
MRDVFPDYLEVIHSKQQGVVPHACCKHSGSTDSRLYPKPYQRSALRIHAEPAEGDQVGLRLVFTNVETEDAGTYTCSDDQDSVSFDLTVYLAYRAVESYIGYNSVYGEDSVFIACSNHSRHVPAIPLLEQQTPPAIVSVLREKKDSSKISITPSPITFLAVL